jgi:hypothetical protein
LESLIYGRPSAREVPRPEGNSAHYEFAKVFNIAELRARIAERAERYDLTLVPITHASVGGRWMGSRAVDGYLYTEEAFRGYWGTVAPGGMLAVVAQDEAAFVRALLTMRKLLASDPSNQAAPAEARMWGLRVLSILRARDPYQYLLLVEKGPPDTRLGARLASQTNQMPVSLLFGPGLPSLRYYAVLQDPGGERAVREVFGQALSQRARAPVEIEPVSDLRPFFFSIVRDGHPFVRSLLAVTVIVLIGCLLFPLPGLRMVDSSYNRERPPVPLFLGCLVLLGMCAAVLFTGLAYQVVPFVGGSVQSLLLSTGAIMLGAGCGLWIYWRHRPRIAHRAYGWTALLVVPVALAYGALGAGAPFALNWPVWASWILIPLTGALAGFVLLVSTAGAMARIRDELRDLVPWAGLAFGSATLTGVIAVNWLARLWGWGLVWGVGAACALLAAAVGYWLWRPQASTALA